MLIKMFKKNMRSTISNYINHISPYNTKKSTIGDYFPYFFYYKANKIMRFPNIQLISTKKFEVNKKYNKIEEYKLIITNINKINKITKKYFEYIHNFKEYKLNYNKSMRKKSDYTVKSN